MAKANKMPSTEASAAAQPPSFVNADIDSEFNAMVRAGLIDAEDLMNKKERKAKLRKQLKGKKPSGGGDYWGQLSGWKSVGGVDDLLLGAEEGGFAGLEVLDDPTLIDPSMFAPHGGKQKKPVQATKPSKAIDSQKALLKTDPGSKKRKADSSTRVEGGDDLKALKARLSALEKENKQLKQNSVVTVARETSTSGDENVPSKKKKTKLDKSATGGEAGNKKSNHENDSASLSHEERKKKKALIKEKKRGEMVVKREARKQRKAEARVAREAGGAQLKQLQVENEDQRLVDVSAWKQFSLHPSLERALSIQGFTKPSEIQRQCLCAAIRDRLDIIGAAQTGSGKTLAFGIPIFQILLQEREALEASGEEGEHQGKLRALILAPTRELALQVCEHLKALSSVCGMHVVAIVGGLAPIKQQRLLASKPQVVVATPGRLWDLMREGNAHLTDLSHLAFLVLDEADKMVQQGHFQELNGILDLVPRPGQVREDTYDKEFNEAFKKDTTQEIDAIAQGEEAERLDALDVENGEAREESEGEGEELRQQQGEASSSAEAPSAKTSRKKNRHKDHMMQTCVFSATLMLPLEQRRRLRKGLGGSSGGATLESLMDRLVFRGEPKIVDLTTERRLAAKVEEAHIQCTDEERDEVLYYILAKHPGRTLVFVNAISSVRRVAAILKALGLPAHALHAQQQQRQRLKAVDRFKAQEQAILVATDVAARGLDIKGVRCVIHYQLPASADTYIHRSGRTGRAAEDGVSIALVTPREAPRWAALTRSLARTSPMPSFPMDRTVMPQVHQRIKLAIKLDEILRAERKSRAENNWAKTNAMAADLEYEEEEEGVDDIGDEGGKPKSTAAKSLQAQLGLLLAAPLESKVSVRFFTGGAAAAVAHGAGLKAASGPGAPDSAQAGVTTETMNKAIAVASRLQESKETARAQQEAKQKGHEKSRKGGVVAKGASGGKKWQSSAQLARKMVLQKELAKKRAGRSKGKLVVIPAAFGRDAQGTDALQALRNKLALIK